MPYHPENHGYSLLGSSNSSDTFYGNYSYYIITTYRDYSSLIDAVKGSDGNYFFSIAASGNPVQAGNIAGAPDDSCADIGGLFDPPVGGFIVLNAETRNLNSIEITTCF
ncbi:hypothetical protein ACFL2E_01330 [Thermodesulfobacteriota bacterium]